MTRGRGNPWPAAEPRARCMDCGGPAHWGDCGEEAQGKIMLEMAAASREQEMWERRFKVLFAQHPVWRTADEDGSWGLRDFLRYAGDVCGFPSPDRIPKGGNP